MIRYQIRNEYGLADPELYAPGEKDDPEALLEGVAMAGLVGVLRQLGDLAEFAAEIFHDLHEDIMATASRGHGLMLRLQQLEAEFPAVEKAIISQTSHSNLPYDDGAEWHANLRVDQNLITQGDMPRFILDSYEECRGPPHLFTLDKFDVAGAGACLKRYTDPSFFKVEFASNMAETDILREKKPRKIKKKGMRWRKGETLETLLIANSESQSTSKNRASSKIPPRTTKLKFRHPRDSDYQNISQICREHILEVISSQQEIFSEYSVKRCRVKSRSTDSSESVSSQGELENMAAFTRSAAKLELTKVVPVSESDTSETRVVDRQFLETQHRHAEVEEVYKRYPLVEQNVMLPNPVKLWEAESNCALQPVLDQRLLSAAPAADRCADDSRPDDIGSDHDNFVDAPNSMASEIDTDPEKKARKDVGFANMEHSTLDSNNMENDNVVQLEIPRLDHGVDSLPWLKNSCNNERLNNADSEISGSVAAQPTKRDAVRDSPAYKEVSGNVDWTNEEPFHDVDHMDVSSSSSVLSNEAGDFETLDNPDICEQSREVAHASCNGNHASGVRGCETQSGQTSSGSDGPPPNGNSYTQKTYDSAEDTQSFLLDDASDVSNKLDDVSEVEKVVKVGSADDLLLPAAVPNREVSLEFKKRDEDSISSDISTSPTKLASLPDGGSAVQIDCRIDDLVVAMDNSVLAESVVGNMTSTFVEDHDGIFKHLDELDLGDAPIPSSILQFSESHDGVIIEELHSSPGGALVTPFDRQAAEAQKVIAVEVGGFSTGIDSTKGHYVDPSTMPENCAEAQDPPELASCISHPEDSSEARISEVLSPTTCALKDETETLSSVVPLLSAAASVTTFSSTHVEQNDSIWEVEKSVEPCHGLDDTEDTNESGIRQNDLPLDVEKYVEPGQGLDDTEDTDKLVTGKVASSMMPSGQELIVGAKDAELIEDVAMNSGEQSSHGTKYVEAGRDLDDTEDTDELGMGKVASSMIHSGEELGAKYAQLIEAVAMSSAEESSCPPCREELDSVVTTNANLTPEGESIEHISEDRISQTEHSLQGCDFEVGSKIGGNDGDPCDFSPMHFPELYDCEEELPEGSSTEALCLPLSETSDAILLEKDEVKEQQADSDEGLGRELSIQDSFCTNPFMDLSYRVRDSQSYACPSISNPAYYLEEQNFLSEVLLQHVEMGENASPAIDSLWEPATPPDEAALLSNAMTDEDLRSFCHEYHEMDFSAGSEHLDDQSSKVPDSKHNHASNGCKVNQLEFPHSIGVLPVEAGEESCVLANSVSHLAPCSLASDMSAEASGSLASDMSAEASVSFATKEDLDNQPSEEESDLKSHDFMNSDNVAEPGVPAFPVELEQESVSLASEEDLDNQPAEEESDLNSHDFMNIEKIAELDIAVFPVEAEQEPCVSLEFNFHGRPYSSDDDKISELHVSPSSNVVLVEQEQEAVVSDEFDSEIVLCSWNNDKIDQLDAHPSIHTVQVELEQEACVSPQLNSQIVQHSSDDKKIDELSDPPSRAAVTVELGKESCVSPQFDSQTAPCSSSDLLAESSKTTSTSVIFDSEKSYQLPRIPLPTELFPNLEDLEKPPPLPPLQWRLGKPRLGALNTNGLMPEPVRVAGPYLETSSTEMDDGLSSLIGVVKTVNPFSSPVVKENKYQNIMVEIDDKKAETLRSSALPTRAEHDIAFSGASENSEHPDPMYLAASEDDKHLNDAAVTEGEAAHPTNTVPPCTVSEDGNSQQHPRHDIAFSESSDNTEHPKSTSSTASEDEKNLDHDGITSGSVSHGTNSLPAGNVFEDGSIQQHPQHGKPFSGTSNRTEHPEDASVEDEKHLNDGVVTGGVCEDGNKQEQSDQTSVGENSQGSLLTDAELMVSQGSLHDGRSDACSLERDDIQPPNPSLAGSVREAEKSNYCSELSEGNYLQLEQPSVMGWTLGPQMLHPSYVIPMGVHQFGSTIEDLRLIRKPYSIRNIPRNPLVEAVAAHDRSTLRKVSELASTSDKPKPSERNLLLEQIRNKSYNLKPVSLVKSASINVPARNLKVTAIVQKANAIRQACAGSDEEDGDNWSDT